MLPGCMGATAGMLLSEKLSSAALLCGSGRATFPGGMGAAAEVLLPESQSSVTLSCVTPCWILSC